MQKERPADRKTQLEEVVRLIFSVCRGKGWEAFLTSQDEDNWRYATVSVSRYTHGGHVKGTFEITLGDRFRLVPDLTLDFNSMLNTRGWEELSREVISEVMKLPWIKAEQPKTAQAQQTGNSIMACLGEVLKRFPKIVAQIGRRHGRRTTLKIKDEYDVQDLLHAVLKGLFEDVRAEEVVPSYAGGGSRLDFLLKDEEIGLEVKLASAKLRDKEIGDQLLIDIGRYQAHQNCKVLFCVVYDPQSLVRNSAGLVKDLSKKHGAMDVRVVVVP